MLCLFTYSFMFLNRHENKPHIFYEMGFDDGSAGKESACNAGDTGDVDSIPGSGISSRGGHGNPLQYSCLENLMDGGAWRATVHRVTKSQSDTTEATERACREAS